MILITSFGEFLLYFIVIFVLFYCHIKKKNSAAGSLLFGVCPVCYRNPFPVDLKILRQAV